MKLDPSPDVESKAHALLGPGGPLAQKLEGYEARRGQLEMAQAVERVLDAGGILLCEAGTGIGKTLAYLLPAILSGRKVVISTATRALQEQIVTKDVPLLARVLGVEPGVAVMKGLANYVCRRRLAEFSRGEESLRSPYVRALGVLDEWLPRTDTGDIAEVATLAEDEPLWSQVTSSSDTRIGSSCPYYGDCFVTKMRRAAERAQIVVVNHHLFFADLALRGPHPGRVLPDYDAVIFDEAHQLEETATTFFGFRVSRGSLESLLADVRRSLDRAGDAVRLGTSRSAGVINAVHGASEALWDTLRADAGADEPRVALDTAVWGGAMKARWIDLDDSLSSLQALLASAGAHLRAGDDSDGAHHADALEVAERRAAGLRERLALIVEGVKGQVTWFDSDGRRAALSAAPIDLSSTLRTRVFDSVPAAVLTSATLTSTGCGPSPTVLTDPSRSRGCESIESGDFSFFRSRLGLQDADEITEVVVPSPFDYGANALFYTPTDLPAPRDPGFLSTAADRTEQLVNLTDGGAFVLTTSLRSMKAIHGELHRRAPARPILVQGKAPKRTLIAEFKATPGAVLVATMSFWEGVDVPGNALRLVVLEKIPFPVPSDPIVQARSLAIEAEGRNAFMEFHVPSAAIALKQGFGRLIRTRADIGIVALLDQRVHRRGYGKRLLRALPPAARTSDFEEVRSFWRSTRG